LIVAAGNPLALEGPADLSERHARFVNRNRGSGTRLWLDQYLSHQGIVPTSIDGFNREVSTHSAAAALVAAGQADAALGIRAAADRADLGFVPLFTERYDLVIPNEVYGTEEVTRLLDRLHGRKFRHDVDCLSGYDSRATGDEYKVAV
jgi:putative molybdopterin biosynthesis protein